MEGSYIEMKGVTFLLCLVLWPQNYSTTRVDDRSSRERGVRFGTHGCHQSNLLLGLIHPYTQTPQTS